MHADMTVLPESWWCCHEQDRYTFVTALNDLCMFGRKLMTFDSWMVLAAYSPLFGVAHMADKPLHAHFYCAEHHQNLRQGSGKLYDASESFVGVTIGMLAACCCAVNQRHLQRTAQMYAITLPLTWAAKSIVKKIEWHDNIRPRNANFNNRVHYGGFPSGHMLEMMYATVLFGLRMGPAFALPIAGATAVVAAAFVRHNRHYASQLVAGAAIGTMFGCAAAWALDELSDRMPISFSVVPHGGRREVALRAQYSF